MAVESFPAAQIGDERTLVFTILNLLAALILLLSLVNVTTLLTARANERIRETAVRLALGASTGRARHAGACGRASSSAWLAAIVGTAGAAWGLEAITRWTRANMEGNLAFWWVWRMDRVTLLSAGAFVTVAIAVLGSVVSLRAIRTNVREVMQDGSARAGSRREGRLARTMVVTQVTTVTVLMFVGVLSGVMARRVVNLDPGYDPANLLQVDFVPPAERSRRRRRGRWCSAECSRGWPSMSALDGVLLRAKLAARDGDRGAFDAARAGSARRAPDRQHRRDARRPVDARHRRVGRPSARSPTTIDAGAGGFDQPVACGAALAGAVAGRRPAAPGWCRRHRRGGAPSSAS